MPENLGLRSRAVAVKNTRAITKRDMVHNDYLPVMEVDSQTYGNAEVFSVSCSAGTRCQNQRLQAADFVSHRKTTLFRWRALRNPGCIYSALPYEVRADGMLLTCEPAKVLPLAQRYFLF